MATTIQDLEERVDALYNSILQMQQNLNPVTEKADDTANKVEQITPTKYTKLGYIGDTEVRFFDVVDGDLSIYIVDTEGKTPFYSVTKGDSICVSFPEPLNYVTTITISIS